MLKADKNNIEAILFSVDFEKAFDSSILTELKSYGSGPDLTQWAKNFPDNAKSCDKSTGHFNSDREHAKGILR